MISTRKPHNNLAGYVCELRAVLGGHIVIYDRNKGFDYQQEARYVVKMEPDGYCIPETNMPNARKTMKYLAACNTIEAANEYYIGAFNGALPDCQSCDGYGSDIEDDIEAGTSTYIHCFACGGTGKTTFD